jgi:hypothetical protein
MKKPILLICCLSLLVGATACAPKVGSDKWCANMKEKPKGDWTASEAQDYAKNCILK